MTDLFHEFPKIRGDEVDKWRTDGNVLERTTFVATEKIHGANFSFIVTRDDIKWARRRAPLKPGENFMGAPQHLPRSVSAALPSLLDAVEQHVRRRNSKEGVGVETFSILRGITVFGELFGGHYPHPDMPHKADGVPRIQRGVAYTPNLEFMAFDIKLHSQDDPSPFDVPTFLDHDMSRKLCEKAGIPFVPEIARGSLADMRRHDVVFTSRVPALLGLPPLPDDCRDESLAEGFVIRPAEWNRKFHPKDGRLMVKVKRPDFAESKPKSKKGTGKTLGPFFAHVRSEMERMVIPSRFSAAVSKVGWPQTQKDQNKAEWKKEVMEIAKEMAADVLEDFKPFPASADTTNTSGQRAVVHFPRDPFGAVWADVCERKKNQAARKVMSACVSLAMKEVDRTV